MAPDSAYPATDDSSRAGTSTVTVRGLTLGAGLPAIIVPVVGGEVDELLGQARRAVESGADLIEWRCDAWLARARAQGGTSAPGESLRADLATTAASTRDAAGDTPLLVTARTAAEGGALDIAAGALLDLYRSLLATGVCDLLDVQMLSDTDAGTSAAHAAVRAAHDAGVPVVGSHHRFDATPGGDELVRILRRMAELGADVPKLAVMPHGEGDVLALLQATLRAREVLEQPLITMSMGRLGAISRLAGELVGSAATFATLEERSAPGQLPLGVVRTTLRALHA